MPSQITHLAVAKRYLEKHPQTILDVQAFLDGNVLPDLASDKAQSHCGIRTERNSLVKRNAEKVSVDKFVATHDLSDCLNQGQYLHLYVDYFFYNDFLLAYFKQVEIKQSSIDMYETSRRDDLYLMQKYKVGYADTTLGDELQKINDAWDLEYVEKRQQAGYHFMTPYNFDELDAFIERMSDITIPQN